MGFWLDSPPQVLYFDSGAAATPAPVMRGFAPQTPPYEKLPVVEKDSAQP